MIDALHTHLELLDAVEIVNFREAISRRDDDYQIAFVEGACTRASDEDRLRKIREQANVVVALGACAHLGGVNTIKNLHQIDEVREYVYGEKAAWYETYPARPIEEVIAVDAVIPGCPIESEEFVRTVKMLLQGRQPRLPETPLCVECKLNETPCVVWKEQVCLGSVVRGGCGAICPANGLECEGCRGLLTTPNMAAFRDMLTDHDFPAETVDAKMTLFLSWHTAERPAELMRKGSEV